MSEKNNRVLREAFGMFSTGITVVTTTDKNKNPIGMTVNSFSSVSLDPPLVLWSIAKKQPSYGTFLEAKGYAVNVLSKEQIELCNLFAYEGQYNHKDGLALSIFLKNRHFDY